MRRERDNACDCSSVRNKVRFVIRRYDLSRKLTRTVAKRRNRAASNVKTVARSNDARPRNHKHRRPFSFPTRRLPP